MQQTRSNGTRQRVNRDPDRRRTREPARFWPITGEEPLAACGRCATVIVASEKGQRAHQQLHEQVDSHDPR